MVRRFTTPEDRDASIKYVMGLGMVDAITIGYKSPAETWSREWEVLCLLCLLDTPSA